MSENQALQQKLKELPKVPGVYFHKNAAGEIIYVGKAAVLRNRVRQYFQKSRARDPKTEALVEEITDIEWIEVETEIDALFLEAEMIRRYQPPYNILLRDDKSLQYVRIDINSNRPTVTMTRRPLDDNAEYFGPYLQGFAVKKALRLLRRIFPYATRENEATMGSKLYEQIGLDPGVASGKTSLQEYRKNLRVLMSYLRGNRVKIINAIEKEMKGAAREQDFERAASLRNKLYELKSLKKQIIFSDREFMDLSKDRGLAGLKDLLSLDEPPKRIEGFDISHMSGTDNVASMVVFVSGMPLKSDYRKFKMRIKGNDDFAHMYEVISRRLSPKNVNQWGLPSLFLIDGGKGQLSSALRARDEAVNKHTSEKDRVKIAMLPMIGLAKREEEIIIHKSKSYVELNSHTAKNLHFDSRVVENEDFIRVELGKNTDIVKLLQRVRDESHRFAVTYHSTLKRSRQTTSWLDEVPGIGIATRKKLIREFGSVRGVMQARSSDLEKVLGSKKAAILKQYIRAHKKSS